MKRVQRLLRDVLLRLNLESVVRDMDRDATTIGLPQLVDLMDTDRDGIVGLEDFIHNWHHLCDAQVCVLYLFFPRRTRSVLPLGPVSRVEGFVGHRFFCVIQHL